MQKYSETHEWVRVEGNVGTVGITDHAQQELGDIVHVELPKVGSQLSAGQEAAVLESTKAATDIYTPVSGEILEVNSLLANSPSLINSSAEAAGWLFKLKLTKPEELRELSSLRTL